MSTDADTAAMTQFLNELDFGESLDELIELDNGNETASDDDQVESRLVTSKRVKSELERERQHVYDKKSRAKKKMNHRAECDVFVKSLEFLVFMVEARVQSSDHTVQRIRDAKPRLLLKTDPADVQEGSITVCKSHVVKQLTLNESVVGCAETWIESWEERRATHKFFMREWADDINRLMGRLKELLQHSRETSKLLLTFAEE